MTCPDGHGKGEYAECKMLLIPNDSKEVCLGIDY